MKKKLLAFMLVAAMVLGMSTTAMAEEIEKCITSTFEKARFDNVDIFDLGEKAYQLKYKDWKKGQNDIYC